MWPAAVKSTYLMHALGSRTGPTSPLAGSRGARVGPARATPGRPSA